VAAAAAKGEPRGWLEPLDPLGQEHYSPNPTVLSIVSQAISSSAPFERSRLAAATPPGLTWLRPAANYCPSMVDGLGRVCGRLARNSAAWLPASGSGAYLRWLAIAGWRDLLALASV